METVTFTCTAPGDLLRWEPSDTSITFTVRNTDTINEPQELFGYAATLITFNDTALTSTLTKIAGDGITVVCTGIEPSLTTIGSSMIRSVGELQLVSRLLSVCTN